MGLEYAARAATAASLPEAVPPYGRLPRPAPALSGRLATSYCGVPAPLLG